MGNIIEAGEARDAIHVAIAPVVASATLKPGQPIAFVSGSKETVCQCAWADGIGIVDPFLRSNVRKGQRFFMCLYPNTITSLRHDWAHPAFVASDSEEWLREFATRNIIGYEQLVNDALHGGEICFGDDDGPNEARTQADDLWRHIEVVTGQTFSEDHRENTYFRCAC